MIQPITVEKPGKAADQKPPKATKVGLEDYHFDVPKSFKGTGTIDITNKGDELHELVVGKLQDGKTIQDVVTWGSQPPFQPWTIPQPYDDIGGITAMSNGNKSRIRLSNLDPGDYGFFCFVPDEEGVSHVRRGNGLSLHGQVAATLRTTSPVRTVPATTTVECTPRRFSSRPSGERTNRSASAP